MQNVRAVVAPVSLPNPQCNFCQTELESWSSRHLCTKCARPQPISSQTQENYFSAFGVSKKFHQDLSLLQKRFYEVSRILHPDRFIASRPEDKVSSLERMSFLNQAYSTLKNAGLLREYILKLEGLDQGATQQKQSIPFELAEDWFELQDLVSEDPKKAKSHLSDFEGKLSGFNTEMDRTILELEKSYDSSPSRELLEKLSEQLQTQNYLKSMERDLERIKKNAYSN